MTTGLLLKGPLKLPWLNAAVSVTMLAFSILTLYALYYTSLEDICSLQAFQLSEFTINYQGGFVRRGLLGEILFQFSTLTGYSPIPIIFTLCWGCFIFVTTFLVYLCHKHSISWWLIPTSYMLGSSYICIIRKDYLVISLFILALYFCYHTKWSARARLLSMSAITAIAILIHESMALLFLPLIALIVYCSHDIKSHLWLRITAFALPLLAMCACSVYTGDATTAQAIHSSWLPWDGEVIDATLPSSSLDALTWSIKDALSVNQSIILAAQYHQPFTSIIYRFIAWGIILYIGTHYVSAMSLNRYHSLEDDNSRAAFLFLLIFICMLPLWLGLSCDFGRLSMHLFVITLISYHYIPTTTIPEWGRRAVSRFNIYGDRILPPSVTITLLIIFTGISPCYFNIEWLWDWSVANSLFEYFHHKWLLFHPQ